MGTDDPNLVPSQVAKYIDAFYVCSYKKTSLLQAYLMAIPSAILPLYNSS